MCLTFWQKKCTFLCWNQKAFRNKAILLFINDVFFSHELTVAVILLDTYIRLITPDLIPLLQQWCDNNFSAQKKACVIVIKWWKSTLAIK